MKKSTRYLIACVCAVSATPLTMAVPDRISAQSLPEEVNSPGYGARAAASPVAEWVGGVAKNIGFDEAAFPRFKPAMLDQLAAGSKSVAAIVLLGSDAASTIRADAIPSDHDGAMLPPSRWTCDIYVAEYRAWLDEGNKPEDWRFEGKTYRDTDSGDLYTVGTWQNWLETADCAGTTFAKNEVATGGMGSLLPILGGTAAAGAAGMGLAGGGGGGESSGGAPAKSPG